MDTTTTQARITTGSYRYDHPGIPDQFTVNQAQELAQGLNSSGVTREIRIDAPGEKVWAVFVDIGSVQDYSPGVVKSYYTSDIKAGIGASRHCDLFPKGTVEERIVSWRDREHYAIEIYDWTEVPYIGVAHFTLKRDGGGTMVSQTMDYRAANHPTGAVESRALEELVARVIAGNLLGLKHFTETGEVVTREVYKRIKKSTGVKHEWLK